MSKAALTAEEARLLDQYNRQRLKHNKVQAEYRKRLKLNDPNYNIKYNEYMRDYNAKRSKMIRNIKNKLIEQQTIPEVVCSSRGSIRNGRTTKEKRKTKKRRYGNNTITTNTTTTRPGIKRKYKK